MTTQAVETFRKGFFVSEMAKSKNPPTALKQLADQFGVILYLHSIWQASEKYNNILQLWSEVQNDYNFISFFEEGRRVWCNLLNCYLLLRHHFTQVY